MGRGKPLVARVIERAKLTMRGMAERSGLSYDALNSWMRGRRTPEPESIAKLADGLERHARELDRLAAELREAAEE